MSRTLLPSASKAASRLSDGVSPRVAATRRGLMRQAVRRVDHQHQRRHTSGAEVRLADRHRAQVHRQGRQAGRPPHRQRAARRRAALQTRQRTPQQPAGAGVRLNDPTAPVQVQDPALE